MSARDFLHVLPNLITVGRFLLVPVTIALMVNQRWAEAFTAFAVAGASDAADGFLARRFNLRTDLGAYLDPLADKALLVSIYIWLAVQPILPATIAILVVSRDVMIVGAVMMSWVMGRPVQIAPLMISKINTAAQIALAGVVLAERAFDFQIDIFREGLLWIVAASTLASMAVYLFQWLKHMTD